MWFLLRCLRLFFLFLPVNNAFVSHIDPYNERAFCCALRPPTQSPSHLTFRPALDVAAFIAGRTKLSFSCTLLFSTDHLPISRYTEIPNPLNLRPQRTTARTTTFPALLFCYKKLLQSTFVKYFNCFPWLDVCGSGSYLSLDIFVWLCNINQ